jgi:hypothetical protein
MLFVFNLHFDRFIYCERCTKCIMYNIYRLVLVSLLSALKAVAMFRLVLVAAVDIVAIPY